METAIGIIRDEHRAISAVLHALKDLAREAAEGAKPALPALRAMIRYIDEFPEKLHHPKEDGALFTRLVVRHPEAGPLVDALEQEHREGARLVRELERALVFLEDGAPGAARRFRDAVEAYADFHWRHMRKEEQKLLPLAERHLTAEDWRLVRAAFLDNPSFDELFTRIVNLAPEPVGLGARPAEL